MMVLNSAVVFGIQTLNSRWTEASQVGVDGDGDEDVDVEGMGWEGYGGMAKWHPPTANAAS